MATLTRTHSSFSPKAASSRVLLSSLGGFIGGNLTKTPYLSPFGALLKLTRLNQFSRKETFAAFGFRLLSREDPSQVLAFSTKRLSSFSSALGIEPDARPGWRLANWLPFQGDATSAWKDSWRTRLCLACAREGFHAWLFQLPWVARCPWHGTRLVNECPSCHRPLAAGFSKGRPLLRCECGVDLFDRRTTLMADPFQNRERDRALAEYLDWASASRTTHYLLPPAKQSHASLALAALVSASDGVAQPLGTSQAHTFRPRCGLTRAPCTNKHRDLAMLGKQFEGKKSSIAELPSSMVRPMRKIARGIATRIPPGSLFPAEAKKFVSDGMIATKDGAARADILYLPVQTGGDRSYLFTNSLPPSSLTAIGDLIQLTRAMWTDEASAGQIHAALRSLIFRAYADGLRIVLSRYVPELYDHPRLAPWEHVPWVMVNIDSVGVSEIRIAWTCENLGGRLT